MLLARHVEEQQWVLSGGAIEPGEVPADAAIREMLEETGIAVRLTGLIGVFGGPDFILHYRNGHRTSYVMTVFEAAAEHHQGRPDAEEVLEIRFMSPGVRLGSAAKWLRRGWNPPVKDADRGASRRKTAVWRAAGTSENGAYVFPPDHANASYRLRRQTLG